MAEIPPKYCISLLKNNLTRWFSLFKPKKATTNNCNWCFCKSPAVKCPNSCKAIAKNGPTKSETKKQKSQNRLWDRISIGVLWVLNAKK